MDLAPEFFLASRIQTPLVSPWFFASHDSHAFASLNDLIGTLSAARVAPGFSFTPIGLSASRSDDPSAERRGNRGSLRQLWDSWSRLQLRRHPANPVGCR